MATRRQPGRERAGAVDLCSAEIARRASPAPSAVIEAADILQFNTETPFHCGQIICYKARSDRHATGP